MVQLVLQNERVCKFYEQNPTINFEAVNIIFVELFEKLLTNINTTMNATINSQILTNVNDNTKKLGELNKSIHHLHEKITHITDDITTKIHNAFINVKKDYIDELKMIVQCQTTENIGSLLEKNNSILIDKTTVLLNEVIPKSNHQSYNHIQETIHGFHKSILDDTKVLITNMDNNGFKDYINTFEMKSSMMMQNLQQPIYTIIKATEERINSQLTLLKDNSSSQFTIQNKLIGELTCVLENIRKINMADIQSSVNIVKLDVILNQMYTTADIRNLKDENRYMNRYSRSLDAITNTNTSSITIADKFILKRPQLSKILIYNVDIDRNINTDETREFTATLEENSCHGVFISQKSGFLSKPNFHIETHNKLIMVYIHTCGYSADKIKNAIDIIDNLSTKLREFNGEQVNEFAVDKSILDEINKEYQFFINQKEMIMNYMKDYQKKMFSQMDDFKFPALDKYLSTKYTTTPHKQGFKCDLCKMFNANNLKALAAHKRGCSRKQSININNTVQIINE
jgi:hypothetical protein